MNRLKNETSPYLLQHANNPVDWYAWKPEAFERARAEDKPILVSIGYSTCHWCHVMERESFEDEEIAAFMNEYFINIKVDREERPDVDQIYMEACQAMTGSGGWPLNCFLLPDGRPFYAGTYYPPQPGYNRPSWSQVLQRIAYNFQTNRQVVEDQAQRLTELIRRADTLFIKDELVGQDHGQAYGKNELDQLFTGLEQRFDRTYGGFGAAPKFPNTMSLQYLLEYHHYSTEEKALRHVSLSLDKMIMGGIYDQLGGGFARYATDQAWLVPHFEKMLYDNALLVDLLAQAYQATGKALYAETIRETLGFIRREMTHPDGGFYSALDADSEGEEGKFYIWAKTEIDDLLGADSPVFCAFYGVSEPGNWEGNNILWRRETLAQFAAAAGADPDTLATRLARCREKLFSYRSKRIRPGLDDKIILGWNALMITAYARAFNALGEEAYRREAIRHTRFLLDHLSQPKSKAFYHVYKDGQAQYDAFLDDYAFLIEALLEVYQISFDTSFLDRAADLMPLVIDQFLDPEAQLFFFTAASQQDVILRRRELYDSATPSGNAVMLHNLSRLGVLLDRPDYRQLAAGIMQRVAESVVKYPASFSRWATEMIHLVFPVLEIAVVGERAIALAQDIRREMIPNKVLMAAPQGDERYPLLKGKSTGGDTKIFLCKNYACQLPVTTLEQLMKIIQEEEARS